MIKTNWNELYQDLPTGTANKLQEARIKPDKLKKMSDGEILSINGIGDAALEKIRTAYPIASIDVPVPTLPDVETGPPSPRRSPKPKKALYRSKPYPLTTALEILTKLNKGKKTNTVELHINTLETGVKGEISLPHATGKKQTIEVFSEKTIVKINAGKLDFDILLATPADMPKLAKYAKVLGPKGLMPTPKNGNLITDPKKRLAQLEKGSTLTYKTEPKFPIIHLSLGPTTQNPKHLSENILSLIKHVNPIKIKSIFLTSTQSPSIKLEF
ncbi:hypothetical protein KJ953_03785 [Patescibacteria group bacterium]|nr:hypothetical protein [Patescibacteria group bacterium]MBU1256297.1 hypothetical protein [Patescibacteria group bacterium]MBU1457533.1 hypothetical protein [Patescibacteria group bacterium]